MDVARRIATLIVVCIWAALTAHAQTQNIGGTWQGTLNPGQELRVVFVISTANAGALTAMMHSIDQGGQGMSASTVTFQGATLRITLAGLGSTFEGQMRADGSSIAGNWMQGGKSLPLTLARANPETAWKIPAPPKPMAADAPAVFEVATIKPSDPNRPGRVFTVKGRQVMTINTTVSDLISFANDLQARQIIGAPEWVESEKYDVAGQLQGEGQPNQRQLKAMIRNLLEDRLKLSTHRESRVLPVYTLVVGETGPKLTKNDTNPNGLPSLLFRGFGVLPALNASMSDLAGVMQAAVLDRPVVDRTGLAGRFDFTLTWTPDESQFVGFGARVPPPSTDVSAPPGLFTAIQEQLGLKLERTKAPVDVLVVDRVEKPSEN
jgi:uncharacterized protein (TIGR03435 family)